MNAPADTPNTAPATEAQVAAFRRFNRFHTRLVGALNAHVSYSDLSLPQVRVLYELAHAGNQALSAADLARTLGVDPGYLSRLITGLERSGLVARQPHPDSARQRALVLTPHGRETFAALDRDSAAEARGLLQDLGQPEREAVVAAMERIQRLLGHAPVPRSFVLRDPRPGDLGWIVHRQAALYAAEYGWDWTFEGLLAEIMATYVARHDPARERCWVAESEGEIVGSVLVVQEDAHCAKLRMLYVEPHARGLGLGRALVDECLAFARARGYRRMVLWTNDVLTAARHIYEACGFRLERSENHHSFGHDLVGQYWARDL